MNFAIVSDSNRILHGLEYKFEGAVTVAKRTKDCSIYLLGETELSRGRISQEVSFPYRWKFDRDDY